MKFEKVPSGLSLKRWNRRNLATLLLLLVIYGQRACRGPQTSANWGMAWPLARLSGVWFEIANLRHRWSDDCRNAAMQFRHDMSRPEGLDFVFEWQASDQSIPGSANSVSPPAQRPGRCAKPRGCRNIGQPRPRAGQHAVAAPGATVAWPGRQFPGSQHGRPAPIRVGALILGPGNPRSEGPARCPRI